MNFIKLLFSFIFLSYAVSAQKVDTAKKKPLNQYDLKGNKQGTWLISHSEGLGETAYSEFGLYDHGSRTGAWYKVNKDGDLLAIENYRHNVFNGEVKYYDNGLLYCIGHYRGLNQDKTYDTITVTDPITLKDVVRVIPVDKGSLRHGMWRYYDPHTGRLLKEQDYQVDSLIYQKTFALSKQDSIKGARMPKLSGKKIKVPAKDFSYIY